MKFPELFIFDMDGLIFDTERLFIEFLRSAMAESGYELVWEVYRETIGRSQASIEAVMKGFYGDSYPFWELSDAAHRNLQAWARSHSLPVKEGVPELLRYLRDGGHPCCIASSSPRQVIDIYLELSGLSPFFSHILSGGELTHSKPHPEIFLSCCRHFGISPESALVFEDSENGVRAALNGNIPVVCIPDLNPPPEELLSRTVLAAETALDVIDFLDSLKLRTTIFC